MFGEFADVGQGQLSFAAQDHCPQRPVHAQQPCQVRRAHVVFIQEMTQSVHAGDFRRVQCACSFS